MINLKEIPIENIKNKIPYFYSSNTSYFAIIKDNNEAGFFGVKELEKDRCEIHLHILPEYRYKVLSRNFINQLINFTFDLGYDIIITCTKMKSWISLLRKFSQYGIEEILWKNSDLDKHWFMIRKNTHGYV